MYKKIDNYFKNHRYYNSFMHTIFGMGLGIIMTYPYFGEHPVRWGIALMTIGALGHLYPLTIKR